MASSTPKKDLLFQNRHLLYNAIKPLIILSKIFGSLPVQIEKINEPNPVSISIFGILHGLANCIFLSVGTILSLVDFEWKTEFLFNLFVIANPFLVISYCGSLIFRAKLFSIIMNDIFNYSFFIQSKNFYSRIFWLILGEFGILGIIRSYHLITLIASFYATIDLNLVMFSAVEYIMKLIALVTNIWLVVLLLILRRIFFEINESLNLIRGNNFFLADFKKIDLGTLIIFYKKVSDTCEILNSSFGSMILAFSTYTTICSASTLFFIVKGSEILTIGVSEIIFIILQEYSILFSFEQVMDETKRTGILVHNLLAQTKDQRLKEQTKRTGIIVHSLILQTKDERLREQLDDFSKQLQQTKVKFTAYGFFPLDYSFVFSMTGTITGYLVMLIQFQHLSTPASSISNAGFDMT